MIEPIYRVSHQFIRMLWNPKAGDRVYLQLGDRRTKHTISKVEGVDIWLSDWNGGPYLARELLYRPDDNAVRQTWDRLKILCEYAQETKPGRWVAKVKFSSGYTILSGKTVRIMAKLLDLRLLDPTINSRVNRLVETAKGNQKVGSVKLIIKQTSEASDPEGSSVRS